MANVIVEEAYLSNIAAAIRSKNYQSQMRYYPSQMAGIINGIPPLRLSMSTIPTMSYSRAVTGSVTVFGYTTFANQSGVHVLCLPDCTELASSTFKSCYDLTAAILPKCSTLGSSAFYACTSLSLVVLSECTGIGANAFYGCDIRELSLPRCQTIGDFAFYQNSNLDSINLPACQTIGVSAFDWCPISGTVSLPECLTIASHAFRSCSMQALTLPKCQYIGSYALDCCHYLSEVNLPGSSVCSIGSMPFPYSISESMRITVPSGMLSDYLAQTNWHRYYQALFDTNGEWGGDYYTPPESGDYYSVSS